MAKRKDASLSKSIGCTMKKYRELRFPGLTQKEVGAKIGVSGQMWSNWETGYRTPDDAYRLEIAKVLGISIAELVGEEKKAPDAKAPGAEPVTYDAVVNACLSVQAAISDVLLHLNRERDLKPFREDLKDLADTARSLQELLSDV